MVALPGVSVGHGGIAGAQGVGVAGLDSSALGMVAGMRGPGVSAARAAGHTEFGGLGGVRGAVTLIQPGVDPLGGPGHELSSSEIGAIITRAGAVPLTLQEQTAGVLDADNPLSVAVVDPVTGRVVDDADNQEVSGDGGQFSDMKP